MPFHKARRMPLEKSHGSLSHLSTWHNLARATVRVEHRERGRAAFAPLVKRAIPEPSTHEIFRPSFAYPRTQSAVHCEQRVRSAPVRDPEAIEAAPQLARHEPDEYLDAKGSSAPPVRARAGTMSTTSARLDRLGPRKQASRRWHAAVQSDRRYSFAVSQSGDDDPSCGAGWARSELPQASAPERPSAVRKAIECARCWARAKGYGGARHWLYWHV
jgi:hypothetical protein